MTDVRFTDFHLFCGAGGGALGFSWATRTYGALRGSFRSLGGVDSHPRRCADFGLLLGKPATCMDLFSAEDYADFHGKAPPDGWREAIGNMVPPRSAQAIAEVLLDTLLQEAAGVTFQLGGGGGIWVNPDDQIGRAIGWQA